MSEAILELARLAGRTKLDLVVSAVKHATSRRGRLALERRERGGTVAEIFIYPSEIEPLIRALHQLAAGLEG